MCIKTSWATTVFPPSRNYSYLCESECNCTTCFYYYVGVFCGSDFLKEAFTFCCCLLRLSKKQGLKAKKKTVEIKVRCFGLHVIEPLARAARGGLLLSLEKWLYHGIIAQVSRLCCPPNKFCLFWGTKLQ